MTIFLNDHIIYILLKFQINLNRFKFYTTVEETIYVQQYTEITGCLYPCLTTRIKVRRRMERSNYRGPDGIISLSAHQYVRVSSPFNY